MFKTPSKQRERFNEKARALRDPRLDGACPSHRVWVVHRPRGTGEPEWRFPETYIDYPNESRYITLDEGGVARVSDIPSQGADCAESSEKNITGEGVWAATGYAVIHIKIDDRLIIVGSGSYRGEPDWGQLIVALCASDVDGDVFVLYHTGYLMGS